MYAENILEILGIGETILSGVLAEKGDISKFDDAREIRELSELNLVVCNLGKHKGETRSSHRVRKRLCYWLFHAAKSAEVYAGKFKELNIYYTVRVGNPLKKKQSLIVIACTLLRIIYNDSEEGDSLRTAENVDGHQTSGKAGSNRGIIHTGSIFISEPYRGQDDSEIGQGSGKKLDNEGVR